jgi:hypothetical protein
VGPQPELLREQPAERRRLPVVGRLAVAVDVEQRRELPERGRVVGGDLLGDRSGLVDDPGDQSHLPGCLGVDGSTREREVGRVRGADRLPEPACAAPGAEQTEFDAGLSERRLRRANPDVAGEREFDAPAPGRAVDASDDDAVGVLDGIHRGLAAPSERLARFAVQTSDGLQVGASAERRSGAVDVDDGLGRFGDGIAELVESVSRECVALGRPLEADLPQAVAVTDVGHREHAGG